MKSSAVNYDVYDASEQILIGALELLLVADVLPVVA